MAYKSGFVAIIGRPNVGKSTFMNYVLGQKVTIISSKPQTTRNRIQGIYTTETEQIIQRAINKVLVGRTSFVIAHRLSTIRNANRILVIKNGKIIEEGDHDTLIKNKGYYYNLYTNQFMEEKSMDVLG